jgi:predicted TIM-barrel fold metal-dependent hydrolase
VPPPPQTPVTRARDAEAALEPDLPVVDAHHHLWDKPGRRYLVEDMAAGIAGSGHTIRATVFVEGGAMYDEDAPPPLRPLGETRFAEASARTLGGTAFCAAIIGYVDLRLGDGAAAIIDRHMAASPRLRGLRNSAVWDAWAPLCTAVHPVDQGLLADGRFRAGFRTLAARGLSFDCWGYFTQAQELAGLADAFPHTTIVSNHCGGLLGIGPYAGRQAEIFAAWRAAIRTLAARPNVVMKLGGLAMERTALLPPGDDDPASATLAAAWQPYIGTCIEAFGPQRCMFESNFPVDGAHCSYTALWNAFKRLTAGFSTSERQALFHDTAMRIYRPVLS